MRKPLVALSLALSTGLGAMPVAGASAATAVSLPLNTAPQHSSSVDSSSAKGRAVSGAAIVQMAMQYLGYPYTATGNSPSTGFSCIGFVSFVYRSNGIPLPGDLGDALNYAPQVAFSDLMPGDVLYFQNTIWAGLSHAAIYIGGGKFVHAEWYNRGVVVSSFVNDPTDGNYWQKNYLAANRPWTGAAISPILGGTPPAGPVSGSTSGPSATAVPGVPPGPTATVTVYSLRVRSGPSKQTAVQQVVSQGTTLVIIGKRRGWYEVRLPDGSIGWVVAAGIGLASSPPATPSATIGNPTAPRQAGYPTAARRPAMVTVRVNGLRVHTGPSVSAPVVNSAARGQRLQIVARRNGWIEVRFPDGSVGWIMGAYTSVPSRSSSSRSVRAVPRSFSGGSTARFAVNVRSGPSLSSSIETVLPAGGRYQITGWSNGWARVQLANGATGWIMGAYASAGSWRSSQRSSPRRATTAKRGFSGGSKVQVAVNVRSGPSLTSSIVTVLAPGGTYRVLGWSNGWAHVQLPSGRIGWISGTVLGGRSAPASYRATGQGRSTSRSNAAPGRGSVLTAGVRVHSSPGVSAPLVGLAAAGTHVRVLGYSRGWALVRLPSGQTGYVLGLYVR